MKKRDGNQQSDSQIAKERWSGHGDQLLGNELWQKYIKVLNSKSVNVLLSLMAVKDNFSGREGVCVCLQMDGCALCQRKSLLPLSMAKQNLLDLIVHLNV